MAGGGCCLLLLLLRRLMAAKTVAGRHQLRLAAVDQHQLASLIVGARWLVVVVASLLQMIVNCIARTGG